jgi:hypothetical protein
MKSVEQAVRSFEDRLNSQKLTVSALEGIVRETFPANKTQPTYEQPGLEDLMRQYHKRLENIDDLEMLIDSRINAKLDAGIPDWLHSQQIALSALEGIVKDIQSSSLQKDDARLPDLTQHGDDLKMLIDSRIDTKVDTVVVKLIDSRVDTKITEYDLSKPQRPTPLGLDTGMLECHSENWKRQASPRAESPKQKNMRAARKAAMEQGEAGQSPDKSKASSSDAAILSSCRDIKIMSCCEDASGKSAPSGDTGLDLAGLGRKISGSLNDGYTALTEGNGNETDAEAEDPNAWIEVWLESAEAGDLDVYTCLGLSNCFTWTPDTRKLLAKSLAVTTMQVVVPCILLVHEFKRGISVIPDAPVGGLRVTGCTLFAYSVYAMYCGAMDECRSLLLKFAFQKNLVAGNWVPLVLGEIANVLVAIILVVTMYAVYADMLEPIDFIQTAVAVNFLANVDAEFVNGDMRADALVNFRNMMEEFNKDNVDHTSRGGYCLELALSWSIWGIAFGGSSLSLFFLFYPDPHTHA